MVVHRVAAVGTMMSIMLKLDVVPHAIRHMTKRFDHCFHEVLHGFAHLTQGRRIPVPTVVTITECHVSLPECGSETSTLHVPASPGKRDSTVTVCMRPVIPSAVTTAPQGYSETGVRRVNIYLIERVWGEARPGELDSIVVVAADEGKARDVATKRCGYDADPYVWLTQQVQAVLLGPCTNNSYDKNVAVCRNYRWNERPSDAI